MDSSGLNPIKMSKDWPVLVKLAREKKLSSSQPRVLAQFIEDTVTGPKEKKAEIFGALLQFLAEEERLTGSQTVVIDMARRRGGV